MLLKMIEEQLCAIHARLAIAVAPRRGEWIMAPTEMRNVYDQNSRHRRRRLCCSHTCKALGQAGMEPVVFDHLVSGHDWAVKWGDLEVGDLLDRDRIAEVVGRASRGGDPLRQLCPCRRISN